MFVVSGLVWLCLMVVCRFRVDLVVSVCRFTVDLVVSNVCRFTVDLVVSNVCLSFQG